MRRGAAADDPTSSKIALADHCSRTEVAEWHEAQAFIAQLQVLCEMRKQVLALYHGGHFDFQEGYQRVCVMSLGGLAALEQDLASLQATFDQWQHTVRATRER